MKFDGASGMRPSAEARRYVYVVLSSALETDLGDPQGWIFGGIDNEFDRRRAFAAARLVIRELRRKGRRTPHAKDT